MTGIISLLARSLDRVHLPRHCFLCASPTPGRLLLCQPCESQLPRTHLALCRRCAEPLAFPGNEVSCPRCRQQPVAFDATVAAYEYRYPVDVLVRHLKYRKALHLAAALGKGLAEAVGHCGDPLPDRIVALPLAPRRFRMRGYNQALEIARVVARALNLKRDDGVLRRVRETTPQAGLGALMRLQNMEGAFESRVAVKGERIALVDDVMTSGATLHSAARVLKAAGAEQVFAWVVARTPPPEFQDVRQARIE
jgi:ComF family protein